MAFRNFSSGKVHAFGGKYLELVPGERLRYTDRFDDAGLAGEMVTTVTLQEGTEVVRLSRGDPRYTEVCLVGGDGTIPLHDGYFEVPLPGSLFEANPEKYLPHS